MRIISLLPAATEILSLRAHSIKEILEDILKVGIRIGKEIVKGIELLGTIIHPDTFSNKFSAKDCQIL